MFSPAEMRNFVEENMIIYSYALLFGFVSSHFYAEAWWKSNEMHADCEKYTMQEMNKQQTASEWHWRAHLQWNPFEMFGCHLTIYLRLVLDSALSHLRQRGFSKVWSRVAFSLKNFASCCFLLVLSHFTRSKPTNAFNLFFFLCRLFSSQNVFFLSIPTALDVSGKSASEKKTLLLCKQQATVLYFIIHLISLYHNFFSCYQSLSRSVSPHPLDAFVVSSLAVIFFFVSSFLYLSYGVLVSCGTFSCIGMCSSTAWL